MRDVKIERLVIKNRTEGVLLSGNDDESRVLVFSVEPASKFVDSFSPVENISALDIGIESVNILHKKLSMVNYEKNFTVEEVEYANYLRRLEIKSGRKTIVHQFSSPDRVSVPKSIADDKPVGTFIIDKNDFDDINSALGTYAPKNKTFSLHGGDNGVTFRIKDDSGVYEQLIDTKPAAKPWTHHWDIGVFANIFKNILKEQDSQTFTVTERGFFIVRYKDVPFILVPRIEE